MWISKEGEITDTVFLLDMQPQFGDYFSGILGKTILNFKLRTYTEVLEIPSETLTNADNIKNFLINQETFSFIRVFVDEPTIANEELLDELEQELNFLQRHLQGGVIMARIQERNGRYTFAQNVSAAPDGSIQSQFGIKN